jgi:hypothetical protein
LILRVSFGLCRNAKICVIARAEGPKQSFPSRHALAIGKIASSGHMEKLTLLAMTDEG